MAADRDIWQSSEARANFAKLVDRAAAGSPQVIRHRGGAEVLMVSRATFENERPTLKEYLLRGGTGEDGTSLTDILEGRG